MEHTNIFKDSEVGGYNPDADGDYHKVTDYARDFNYTQGQIARAIKALSSNPDADFMILYGGVVTDSGGGQVDISAGVAIGQNSDDDVRFIILPAQSNVPMPTGWDDGRQLWVTGQHEWVFGSSTRNHKQTVTSYHYTVEDSFLGNSDTDDLFVDADPNSPSEATICWGSFTMTGATFAEVAGERTDELAHSLNRYIEKIETVSLDSDYLILAFELASYTDCVSADIGRTVVGGTSGDEGTLRAYNNTTRKWLIETSDSWNDNDENVTITSGTGAGNLDDTNYSGGGFGEACVIDLSLSNVFSIDLDNDCYFYFTNIPSSGVAASCSLMITKDANATEREANFSDLVKWTSDGGGVPDNLDTSGQIDYYSLITHDGGTIWLGFTGGTNFSV
ncbi:MAG: hypothetical protein GY853_01920 [PVC group bacterium]|nr:hypothetical protein [PVC group bacterium]